MSSFFVLENVALSTVEMKATQKGKTFAKFKVLVEQGFGQNKTTGTVKMTAWDTLAEQIGGLDEGTKLNIYGRLNANSYEYQGKTIEATDLVVDAVSIRFTKKDSGDQSTRIGHNFL